MASVSQAKPSLMWSRGAALVNLLCGMLLILLHQSSAQELLPNCSFPAVYAFGDSLTDVGNAIATFPDKFAHAEMDPNGFQFPTHPADRFVDGKLLIDLLAFGVRRRPIYPVLRGTSPDFTYGTNFAACGGTARNVTSWDTVSSGFLDTPFGLNVQLQWLQRHKVRVWFHENLNGGIVNQSLPKLATMNSSLFLVYSGYHDYFSSLYDQKLTPRQTLEIVPEVVDAIITHLEGMVTVWTYNSPAALPVYIMPAARTILVLNLIPLGCVPAMLTIYQTPDADYDSHGCLTEINKITSAHNELLGEKVIELRTKYPEVKFYYGDTHGVYTDILKEPALYNVTAPLKACCGVGGSYNFNKGVKCGELGTVGNEVVNLTVVPPCANSFAHLSWDGIHTSNTFNKAAVTAFLTGKHITPEGGLQCSPDYTNFDSPV